MTSHPNRSRKSNLRSHEARALRVAVCFMLAGETDDFSDRDVDAAKSALAKMQAAPEQSVWVPFSRKEMEMLCFALSNGAEGMAQTSSGLRPDQRSAFRQAANRIAEAGGFQPEF